MVIPGHLTYLVSIITNMFELRSSDTAGSLRRPMGLAYIFRITHGWACSHDSQLICHTPVQIHSHLSRCFTRIQKNPLRNTQWAFESSPLLLFSGFNALPVSVLPRQCLIHQIHLMLYSLASFAYIRTNNCTKEQGQLIILIRVHKLWHQTNWLYLLHVPHYCCVYTLFPVFHWLI